MFELRMDVLLKVSKFEVFEPENVSTCGVLETPNFVFIFVQKGISVCKRIGAKLSPCNLANLDRKLETTQIDVNSYGNDKLYDR